MFKGSLNVVVMGVFLTLLYGCASEQDVRYVAMKNGEITYQTRETDLTHAGKNYVFCKHCLSFNNEKIKKTNGENNKSKKNNKKNKKGKSA